MEAFHKSNGSHPRKLIKNTATDSMKKIAGLGPIISNVDGEIMTAVKQAPEAL